MPLQTINLGTYANDGTGDDLRTAFEKVNGNFTFLDNLDARDAVNLGLGSPVFAGKTGTNFQFRSIAAGNNLVVSHNGTTITLATASVFTGNVTGNLTGNVTGNLTGNVTGNLSGTATTVSDISNHALSELIDVSETAPTQGQVLTYQNSLWRAITPTSNVIISDEGAILTSNANSINLTGSGVTASAINNAITINVPGLSVSNEGISIASSATSINFVGDGVNATALGGSVTVSVSGGGGGLDFGTFSSPGGFAFDLGTY